MQVSITLHSTLDKSSVLNVKKHGVLALTEKEAPTLHSFLFHTREPYGARFSDLPVLMLQHIYDLLEGYDAELRLIDVVIRDASGGLKGSRTVKFS